MSMNSFSKNLIVLFFLILVASCGKSKDPKQNEQTPDSDDARPTQPDIDPDLQDGTSGDYSVEDLQLVAEKATRRFTRLDIPGADFVGVKTWATADYIWARLTYLSSPEMSTDPSFLFLACHFHGTQIGCHKKDDTGPDEPVDF